jgi:hypothetical protein
MSAEPNTLNPPYAVTGLATIFGLNWDGSDDKGDEDSHGRALKGAWGDVTHSKTALGCALPIVVLYATFGNRNKPKAYKLEFYSHLTEKTVTGVAVLDEGPNARLHRPCDLTWLVHQKLGHMDYFAKKYGKSYGEWPSGAIVTYWIENSQSLAIPVHGWDFTKGRVVGS